MGKLRGKLWVSEKDCWDNDWCKATAKKKEIKLGRKWAIESGKMMDQ
jgi:hypothetical protein